MNSPPQTKEPIFEKRSPPAGELAGFLKKGNWTAPEGKYTYDCREAQAERIRARFVVSPPLARVIAEHAFAGGAA